LHYIVVDSVRNVPFSILLVGSFFEDCAETFPPSAEALGRLKNLA
jgi:hypothetical protein